MISYAYITSVLWVCAFTCVYMRLHACVRVRVCEGTGMRVCVCECFLEV